MNSQGCLLSQGQAVDCHAPPASDSRHFRYISQPASEPGGIQYSAPWSFPGARPSALRGPSRLGWTHKIIIIPPRPSPIPSRYKPERVLSTTRPHTAAALQLYQLYTASSLPIQVNTRQALTNHNSTRHSSVSFRKNFAKCRATIWQRRKQGSDGARYRPGSGLRSLHPISLARRHSSR